MDGKYMADAALCVLIGGWLATGQPGSLLDRGACFGDNRIQVFSSMGLFST